MIAMKLLYTQSGVNVENMAFALPVNGVKQIADAIILNGEFTGENPIARGRTLIGITGYGIREGYWYSSNPFTGEVTESSKEVAGYTLAQKNGVFVTDVTGAAVLNKLQTGDVIMKINGYSLAQITELIKLVNLREAGEEVTLLVWRNGVEVEVTITLMEAELS
jgi:S1-C subfamily serine protease